MDPQKLAMLMALIRGQQGQGQGGMPMPGASPPMGMGMAPAVPPQAPPQGSLSPPQAAPGAMLSAAGMQAAPTDAPMPSRPGGMGMPAAPTTQEATTPRGLPPANGIPMFPRTSLGALLMPGMISGG